jgi:Mitochondrial import protein Pam17
MWRLTHRKTLSLIEDKEKLFHQHIKRNRVDPSTQSATNPVPDFYGELPTRRCDSVTKVDSASVIACCLEVMSDLLCVCLGEKISSIKEYRQWLRDQVCVLGPRSDGFSLSDCLSTGTI